MPDSLDTLTDFVPDTSAEWDAATSDAVLADILDGTAPLRVRHLPTHTNYRGTRWRVITPIAAAVAVIAVGWALLFGDNGGEGHGTPAGDQLVGTPFTPPAGLSGHALDPGQYVRYIAAGRQATYTEDASTPTYGPLEQSVQYLGYDGRVYLYLGADQVPDGKCTERSAQPASLDAPSADFYASLPTDVDALQDYLLKHAEGSTSRDESVFVEIQDSLSTAGGLASPKLRAAMLAVLSRTSGVYLHQGVTDQAGNPAIRVDFVDQGQRPDYVQSMFFDPTTFAVTATAEFTNGQPAREAGPSAAYTADRPTDAVDPDDLGTPTSYQSYTETVVDALPASCQ